MKTKSRDTHTHEWLSNNGQWSPITPERADRLRRLGEAVRARKSRRVIYDDLVEASEEKRSNK